MAVIKVEKTGNYTVMSNYHFREKSMSLKAKGLLSMMLSLPPDWDYSVEGLITLSSDGETSVRSGLKELEEFGYLKRQRVYVEGKIAGVNYTVYEEPQLNNNEEENLSVENQVQGNRPQLSTKQLNTNNIKNKGETSSPSSAKKSSKLFSASKKTTPKQEKWINRKFNILDEFDFTEEVKDELVNFFISLAESDSLLADITIRMQLQNLYDEVKTDTLRIEAIRGTITRGWKSLEYKIKEMNKPSRYSFDTAKNSQNQFHSEEEKQLLREQIANASEDDIF